MRYLVFSIVILISSNIVRAQQFISPDNPAFTYSGRFDYANPGQVRYDWPGTSIFFQFTGRQLEFLINGGKRNYFNVFIDGQLHEILHAPNDTAYVIKGIKGRDWHTCQLQKRTEGEMGTSLFKGIRIASEGKVKEVSEYPTRKIEFIGNSITCGYGTEGASRDEDFLPQTENVNKSYAFITARAFNAECYVTAHSGLGVVRNYGDKDKISTRLATLPQRYHQTLDMDSLLCWDFFTWQPNAVVINLGTNDYSTGIEPDSTVFIQTYMAFIRQIRKYYGEVPIFCICGPMQGEPALSNIKKVVEASRLSYKDKNLYFIGIPDGLLNKGNDLGSDWHPSYRGQKKMAAHIVPTIASVLQWNYCSEELKVEKTTGTNPILNQEIINE